MMDDAARQAFGGEEADLEGAADDSRQEAAGPDISSAIDPLRAEISQLKDQALRYAAEAENTRRRAEREINDARAYAIQTFARDLFGVSDNLERALDHAPRDSEDPATRNLVVGLEMTQKALASAFERNGVNVVRPAAGERFDPHRHQAMMEQMSEEVAAGGVIQVLQAGYELHGRIVRPAMVVVASRGSAADRAASDAPEEAATAAGP